MKQRVKDMEDEAAKLRDMQAEVEKSMNPEEGILQIDRYTKSGSTNIKRWKQTKKPLIIVQYMLAT